MPAAENVQVQVAHRLAAVGAAVDDEAVAGLGQSRGGRDADGREHEFSRQATVGIFQLRQAANVAPRDHQNMGRCLGVDVSEGQEFFIAVHLGAWYFACGDIAEKTGSHFVPSRWGFTSGHLPESRKT